MLAMLFSAFIELAKEVVYAIVGEIFVRAIFD